jgi:hypothetical protein
MYEAFVAKTPSSHLLPAQACQQPFPIRASPVCGSREGYKVNSRMGPHPGRKIIAAGHNIKDTRWKKIFQPISSLLVTPNGRNCIRYRKSCDASPIAGSRMLSSTLRSKRKRDSTTKLTRMNDSVEAAETAFAAIETRPARSAKSWSIEADVKELEPSVTAT